MRRPQLNALLIGGLIAALLAGIGLSHSLNKRKPQAQTEVGLILPQARALKPFSLQTQAGETYNQDSYAAQWQLMFFGFTHCPDVCPNTLALMKQLRQNLPADVQENLRFVFVSVDPLRDTVEVMRDYIEYFDPSFIGVTGDPAEIENLSNQLGIGFVSQREADAQDYSVDHSTALVLLQPGNQVKAYFSAPHSLSDLTNALQSLIQP